MTSTSTLQHPKHRLFEKRQAEIDLLVAYGKRRGEAEDAAHSRQLDNIHAKSERHALARDSGAKVGRNLFSRTAFDDLDTKQQSTPANVADTFKSLLQLPQPALKSLTGAPRALYQAVPLNDFQDLQADCSGQWIRDMRRIEKKSSIMTRFFDRPRCHHRRKRQSSPQGFR